MTSYLVTIETDRHWTWLKMRARDKGTVTENIRCWCFILWEKLRNRRNSETLVRPTFRVIGLFKNELLIYVMDYKHNAVPLFLNSKVFPRSFIYFDWLCNIMWDVANNSAPENIKRAITRISEVHSYSTRSTRNLCVSSPVSIGSSIRGWKLSWNCKLYVWMNE